MSTNVLEVRMTSDGGRKQEEKVGSVVKIDNGLKSELVKAKWMRSQGIAVTNC